MAIRSAEAVSTIRLEDEDEGYDFTGGFEHALNDGDEVTTEIDV